MQLGKPFLAKSRKKIAFFGDRGACCRKKPIRSPQKPTDPIKMYGRVQKFGADV